MLVMLVLVKLLPHRKLSLPCCPRHMGEGSGVRAASVRPMNNAPESVANGDAAMSSTVPCAVVVLRC
jgi:hypothetical protein